MHVCLYYITPIKSIDLVCMKKLDQKVNIIPIIAKADTVNKAELAKFKAKIMIELKANSLPRWLQPRAGQIPSCRSAAGAPICLTNASKCLI